MTIDYAGLCTLLCGDIAGNMKDGDAAEGITNVSVSGLEGVGEEVAERDWFNSILANQKERLEESTAYINQHLQ